LSSAFENRCFVGHISRFLCCLGGFSTYYRAENGLLSIRISENYYRMPLRLKSVIALAILNLLKSR